MIKLSLLVTFVSVCFAGCALDPDAPDADELRVDDDEALLDRGDGLPSADESDVLAPDSARRCGYSVNKLGSAYWKNCTAGKQLIHVDIRLGADKYKCVQPGTDAFLIGGWGARGASVVGTSCR